MLLIYENERKSQSRQYPQKKAALSSSPPFESFPAIADGKFFGEVSVTHLAVTDGSCVLTGIYAFSLSFPQPTTPPATTEPSNVPGPRGAEQKAVTASGAGMRQGEEGSGVGLQGTGFVLQRMSRLPGQGQGEGRFQKEGSSGASQGRLRWGSGQ